MPSPATMDTLAQAQPNHGHATISRPIFKFMIGFTAGLCAALFPRLTALLLVSEVQETLDILSLGYVLVSLLFATLIGAIIMIMEWNVAKEPRTTFMAALGIPALITGSINTLDSTKALQEQVAENRAMYREVEKLNDINVIRSGEIQPLSFLEQSQRELPPLLKLIPAAHAADEPWTQQQQPRYRLNPSIQQAVAPRYVVVLEKSNSKEAAVARASELSNKIPAQAILSEQGFLIIKRGPPVERSEALVEALRIRNELQIQADILELQ